MRSFPAGYQTALGARVLIPRWFFWVTVTDGVTPSSFGWWTGPGNVTADMADGITGNTVSRAFRGGGVLIDVAPIRYTSDLSVRAAQVQLSDIDSNVETAFRGNTGKQAPMQLHLGLLDTVRREMITQAQPMFVGFVDGLTWGTPAVGSAGSLTVRCVSHARELMRTSSETRSRASQIRRSSSDRFYDYTASAPNWKIKWGNKYKG